jgi:hypothetical protein
VGDIDLIIKRVGNLVARRELEDLRRIDRWARALVASWQRGGDDPRRAQISAELEAAVLAAGGGIQVPGQEGRS